MGADAVRDLAGDLAHIRVDRGQLDPDVGVLERCRRKQRHHQAQRVVLAVVIELRAVLPAGPDRAQRADIIAQPRPRRRPAHPVAPLDMALDLRTEAQRKAPLRQPRQTPGAQRRDSRAPRKRDRDGGGEAHTAGRLRRQRQHDERILLRLLGQDAVIAELLGKPRIRRDPRDVQRHRGRAHPRIKLPQRQQRLDFHPGPRTPSSRNPDEWVPAFAFAGTKYCAHCAEAVQLKLPQRSSAVINQTALADLE